VRDRKPTLSLEEHSLRRPGGLLCRRDHLPQPRSCNDVRIRHSDARPLHDWDRRSLVGTSLQEKGQGGICLILSRPQIFGSILGLLIPISAAAQHFDGAKAYQYAREFVTIGPRWPTGPGYLKAEAYLREHFQHQHDAVEEDTFTADTPIGPV